MQQDEFLEIPPVIDAHYIYIKCEATVTEAHYFISILNFFVSVMPGPEVAVMLWEFCIVGSLKITSEKLVSCSFTGTCKLPSLLEVVGNEAIGPPIISLLKLLYHIDIL